MKRTLALDEKKRAGRHREDRHEFHHRASCQRKAAPGDPPALQPVHAERQSEHHERVKRPARADQQHVGVQQEVAKAPGGLRHAPEQHGDTKVPEPERQLQPEVEVKRHGREREPPFYGIMRRERRMEPNEQLGQRIVEIHDPRWIGESLVRRAPA